MIHMATVEEFEKHIIDQINKYKNKKITRTMVFINIRHASIYDPYNQSRIGGRRIFIKFNYRFKFKTLQDLLYLAPSIFTSISKEHPDYNKLYELYKYLTI